jgi:hypothetical protein
MFLLRTVHDQQCVQMSCVQCNVVGLMSPICFSCVKRRTLLKVQTGQWWFSVTSVGYQLNTNGIWKTAHRLTTRCLVHHISVMKFGHLLTRSDLTYPEVSSKVCHDSFCQLGNSVSSPWVIYYRAFYLHVVSNFSYIPVICLKWVLFLIPLQFVYLSCNQSKCILFST